MAEIEVKVTDRVAPSISTSLQSIATQARNADTAVKKLQAQLNSMNAGAMNAIMAASANSTKALLQAANAAAVLATQQQKTAAAAAQAAAAQNNIVTSATKAATAQQQLATATAKTAAAGAQASTAAQKLATEERKTATAAAQAAAASDRAAMSALRLSQAQERASKATKGAADTMLGYVRAAAAAASAFVGARAILDSADAFATLQNKLQNVTTSQGQVSTLMERLFDIANETRTSVEATTTAFARFDRALNLMGKSQEDTLRMTETINKALIVSGATAQETSSALLQLSQAFNSGKLNGDEFRAISENMPAVLDALSKALGKPVNELKKLSAEGKITSEVMFNAFKAVQDSIDEKFAKTVSTVGQAFEIASNKAIKFFGSMSISPAIAQGIISLSNHMKEVTVAAVALGAAMLVAFGPQIAAAIATTTGAVKAFTVALASNPVGLLAVALASAVAYLILFRDEVEMSIDGVTTFGDICRAVGEGIVFAFELVKDAVSDSWASLSSAAGQALDLVSKDVSQSTKSWTDDYTNFFKTEKVGWAAALEGVAKYIDAVSGFVRGLATFLSKVMTEVIEGIRSQIPAVVNAVIGLIEQSINVAVEGINKVLEAFGKEKIQPVNFQKLKEDGAFEFSDMGKLWRQSMDEGFKSQGNSAQDAVNATLDRAKVIGRDRNKDNGAKLRDSGINQLGSLTDEKLAKTVARRADALAKVNLELDNELNRMFKLQEEREAQARFDSVVEGLAAKKIKLEFEEAAAIKEKIDAIVRAGEVQKQFDRLYSEATQPQKEYNATQEAANKLLKLKPQLLDDINRSLMRAKEEYLNSADPMRQYNKEMGEEYRLLKMLPAEREIEIKMIQLKNKLLSEGIKLLWSQEAAEENRLANLQQMSVRQQAMDAAIANSQGRRQDEMIGIQEIIKAQNDVEKNFDNTDARQALTQTETGGFVGNSTEMINAEVARLDKFYDHMRKLREGNVISEQEMQTGILNIWLAQQDLRLQKANQFFGAFEGMMRSKNKAMFTIGKTAAIANAIINTYRSATGAYAAMSSIQYVGPALGVAAASAAVMAGMANVQAIRNQSIGFESGGYTGNMPTNEVAGLVHGREFVMDAKAVDRIGLRNLQALQSGAQSVNRNRPTSTMPTGASARSGAAVGTTVNMRNINVLDPALVGDYLASPQGEQVFINTLRRNSDQVRNIVTNG
jgi:tape measure domain-containing protein